MKVNDWIAQYLHSIGVERIHGLMGGGAAALNDGFIKHPNLEYVCYHHEQGAGHAAIGESKYTGQLSVVNPTTGCGGTNCATSVLNAWHDGVPVLFISGNVRLNTCSHYINKTKNLNLRHYGIQEHHIVDTYKNMTKMAVFVERAEDVPATLQKAVYLATTGRKGPVWIDIPGDIQAAELPEYKDFEPYPDFESEFNPAKIHYLLGTSVRPLIVAGQGIRQSGCIDQFMKFVDRNNIPFVTTYGGKDIAYHHHHLNIGVVGVRGTRAGNFAMQNADLLIILGTSLNASVVGYDPKQFSPMSYKVYVDIDHNELLKDIIPINYEILTSIDKFLGAFV